MSSTGNIEEFVRFLFSHEGDQPDPVWDCLGFSTESPMYWETPQSWKTKMVSHPNRSLTQGLCPQGAHSPEIMEEHTYCRCFIQEEMTV